MAQAYTHDHSLGRHIKRLRTASAAIVGEHDDATVAHREQPRAGRRHRDQQRPRGEPGMLGGRLGWLCSRCARYERERTPERKEGLAGPAWIHPWEANGFRAAPARSADSRRA